MQTENPMSKDIQNKIIEFLKMSIHGKYATSSTVAHHTYQGIATVRQALYQLELAGRVHAIHGLGATVYSIPVPGQPAPQGMPPARRELRVDPAKADILARIKREREAIRSIG